MLEIIVAAVDQNLTTVEAVKADLGVTSSDQDARLADLIAQYSAAIVGWLGRPLALEGLRETIFNRAATDGLMLARWPIVSVASVTVDGTEIPADSYTVDAASGMLYQRRPGCGFWWPRGETIVSYDAGYILPAADDRTLPHDIERAAIILVKSAQLATGRDPLVRSETEDGVGGTTYFSALGTASDGMPLEVQGLLSPYRHPVAG